MGVISKFKNLIGLEDYDDELDEYEEEEYEQRLFPVEAVRVPVLCPADTTRPT